MAIRIRVYPQPGSVGDLRNKQIAHLERQEARQNLMLQRQLLGYGSVPGGNPFGTHYASNLGLYNRFYSPYSSYSTYSPYGYGAYNTGIAGGLFGSSYAYPNYAYNAVNYLRPAQACYTGSAYPVQQSPLQSPIQSPGVGQVPPMKYA